MNKYIYSAAAFLSLSCIALTSCQNEMEQIGAPAGKEVLLRVTANRGDAETRTTLTPDGGDLVCNWSEGDQLMVVGQSTGKKIGVVTLVSGEDTSNGVFEGNVDLTGNSNVSLVYLGTAENAETYSAELNNLSINLSAQNGTFASLTDKDVLTSEPYVIDNTLSGKAVEIADVTMTRQLAFGHFYLDFGGDVTLAAGDVITIAGEGLKSSGKVNFKNGGSLPSVENPATTITVTKTEGGNDFYVTMLPCGNVTPTFTVVKGGETYTATLGAHNWVSGEYVRAYADGNDSGVSVTMEKVVKPKSDGKILGIKWAAINDRSWIDCTRNIDDAYFFSYIPGIPLSEQGLEIQYPGNIAQDSYIYHFQWGRNFGFIASDGSGATINSTPLPNQSNLPSSWPSTDKYYGWNATLQLTPGQSVGNPYILMCGYDDWSKTTFDSWPMYEITDEDTGKSQLLSVAPKGFRLPTMDDFETLLPAGSDSHGVTYKPTTTFTIDSETVKPFFAKKTSEGTTVIWTILKAASGQFFLALYEVEGSYELSAITKDILENKVLDYIDFPAHGCRSATYASTWSGTQCTSSWQYKNAEGWYWSDTVIASDKTKAGILRFSINSNQIVFYLGQIPKKNALSVRCIYED